MFSDRETTLDALGFEPYVESLTEVILSSGLTPFTIGIYGNWGKGKTSLMKMIKEEIDKKIDIKTKTIWFNAWKFEKEKDIWVALIETMLNEIETINGGKLKKVRKKIERLRHSVEWSQLAGFVTSVLLTRPNFEKISKSVNIKEKIRSLHVFEKEFEELIELCEIDHLIVFIDDLDRCKEKITFSILEAIKLLLNSRKCVYVLGLDYYKICKYLKEKSEEEEVTGEYLDKIIQLPFFIPKITNVTMGKFMRYLLISKVMKDRESMEDLSRRVYLLEEDEFDREVIEKNVYDLNIKQKKEYCDIIDQQNMIVNLTEYNPRKMKRFLNTYFLRTHMAEKFKNKFDVQNEYLMKFLFLQMNYKDFYQDIETYENLWGRICLFISGKEKNDIWKESALKKHVKDKNLISFLKEMKFENIKDPKPYLLLAEIGSPPILRMKETDLVKDLFSDDFIKHSNAIHIFSRLEEERKKYLINIILEKDIHLNIVKKMGKSAVEPLINILEKTEDEPSQKKIAGVLEKIGSPAVEPLINILEKTEDEPSQKKIAGVLEKIGSPAVEPLINILEKTEDEVLKWHALSILKNIGPSAVENLLILLNKSKGNTKWNIISILGTIGNKKAVSHLLNLLKETDNESLQENIISSLEELEGEKPVDELLNILQTTEYESLQKNIIWFLGELKNKKAIAPLIDLLQKTEDESLLEVIIWCLGKIKDKRAVEPLLEILEKTEDSLQWNIISALGKIKDKRAVEPLLDLFQKTEDESLQKNIIWCLGKIKDKRAVEPLLDLFQRTEDESLQLNIIATLGEIKDKRAVEILFNLLEITKNTSLQEKILFNLKKIGATTLETLLKFLQETEDESLQLNIIATLGEIKDKRAVKPLLGLLHTTENKPLLENIVSCLEKIKDKRAVEPLLDLLQKAEGPLQWNIISALGKIKDERAMKPLLEILEKTKDGFLQRDLVSSLSEGGLPAMKPLLDLLQKTEDKTLKWNILWGMGKIKDKRAVEPLLDLLQKTEDESLQLNIIATLGEIKDKRAVDPLLDLLQKTEDESLQLNIIATLGEIKDKRAVEPLLDLFQKTEDEFLQRNITLALLNIGTPEINLLSDILEKIEDNKKRKLLKKIIEKIEKNSDKK
ncbi:MAG: HEAT repeat domain-containing protein [Candidatus Methanofastidiosia archaeon]|jgi:HEAT repeat protein